MKTLYDYKTIHINVEQLDSIKHKKFKKEQTLFKRPKLNYIQHIFAAEYAQCLFRVLLGQRM